MTPGFFTTAACGGSTFTYFNPTSSLGASSGGTVTLSPIFTQGLTHTGPETISGKLTMTNHNQIFWAGPGATPTIDQAVTACGTNPCIVEISPLYTGPESTNVVTTNTSYKAYNGPNNVSVIDRRAVDSGAGNPTGTVLYPFVWGGRNGGQLTRTGVNYWASSPSDSVASGTNFTFMTGAMPSNIGQINGSVSVAVAHDAITYGTATNIIDANDSEAYFNASSSDKAAPQVIAYNAGVGILRSTAQGSIATAAQFSAPPCTNPAQGVAVFPNGAIANCYGFDSFVPTTGGVGTQRNYGFHSRGNWLTENGTSFDFTDSGFNISALSESGTTVTVTTSGTCSFPTGSTVYISGTGTANTLNATFGYNGTWTVLTPGCNGTNAFTYTNTVSGLATLGAGGTALGVHKALYFNGGSAQVELRPYLDSTGWNFIANDGTSLLTLDRNRMTSLVAQKYGEAGPPSGAAGFETCYGDSTAHALKCSYNNGTFAAVPLVPSSPLLVGLTSPNIVAEVNLTAQQANISATTLYAVPASGVGMYRASCYVVETQAATTSSTTPGCQIIYTDADTSAVKTISALDGASTNVVGAVDFLDSNNITLSGVNIKASTNIQYQTSGYASSGATPMQYAIHIRLEYLGP